MEKVKRQEAPKMSLSTMKAAKKRLDFVANVTKKVYTGVEVRTIMRRTKVHWLYVNGILDNNGEVTLLVCHCDTSQSSQTMRRVTSKVYRQDFEFESCEPIKAAKHESSNSNVSNRCKAIA